jgi:hypothetical protein
MKNIVLGGISGDAFLSVTGNAVSERNISLLIIGSRRERSQSEVMALRMTDSQLWYRKSLLLDQSQFQGILAAQKCIQKWRGRQKVWRVLNLKGTIDRTSVEKSRWRQVM